MNVMNGNRDEKRFVRMQRRVTTERDGMRDGGLVVCIALIGGMILAATVLPGALTSFWIWFAILSMAAGCGVSVQRLMDGKAEAESEI